MIPTTRIGTAPIVLGMLAFSYQGFPYTTARRSSIWGPCSNRREAADDPAASPHRGVGPRRRAGRVFVGLRRT